MKTSLKLLIFSLFAFLLLPSAFALDINGNHRDFNFVSEKNGFHLSKVSDGRGFCIINNSSVSENSSVKLSSPLCPTANLSSIEYNNSEYYFLDIVGFGNGGSTSPLYYLNKETQKIFLILNYTKDGERKYIAPTINNPSLLKITSKRGSGTYQYATIRGQGITLISKKGDQASFSSIIGNLYSSYGFAFQFNYGGKGYILDSVNNKAYEYSSFLVGDEYKERGRTLALKVLNIEPDFVYDIIWGIGTSKAFYSRNRDNKLNFAFENRKKATEADFEELKKNFKDSINIFSEKAYDWMETTPEEFGLGSNNLPDKPKTGDVEVSGGSEAKKACIDNFSMHKSMTVYSDGCFGPGVPSEERLAYWSAITTDSDLTPYEHLKGGEYIMCSMFRKYKEDKKKQLGEKRPEFWKYWTLNFLGLGGNDVDPQALCSHISVENKGNDNKQEDKNIFEKAWDWLTGRSGEPLLVDENGRKLYPDDFGEEYTTLRSLLWTCRGLDRFGLLKIKQTEQEKKQACEKYETAKNKLKEKRKGIDLGAFYSHSVDNILLKLEGKVGSGVIEALKSDVQDTLSEGGEVLLKAVKDPFYSGYNSVLPLQCSNKMDFPLMNYVAWGLFAILAFIFLKLL